MLILHDLRQEIVNVLVQWILEWVPFLETSLDPTWIFNTPNDDWISKSWSKKSTESVDLMLKISCLGSQKDWLKIKIFRLLGQYACFCVSYD
jgi:hypothetical protein